MSERLSDEELDWAEQQLESRAGKYPGPSEFFTKAIAELKERRARDLTAEEREALVLALEHLDCSSWMPHQRHDPIVSQHAAECERASAAIQRVLGDGGAK